ncbi:MAG: putative outer membrane protein OmpA/MotB family [Nitrospira sp.]|jgi:chemotaxis protein MotB|nr:putative outer membrane protein OmpA/MotB family [Nitrospira sp.]
MRQAARTLIILSSIAAGCATAPRVQPVISTPSPAETKLLALQQEREQLLVTLGEFHDRVSHLESKLADRESQPVAASYDQLLSIKEAELTDLRKLAPERDQLRGQLAAASSELHQSRQRIAALELQFASREKDLAALQSHTMVVANLDVARRRIAELEGHMARQENDLRALRPGTAERDSLTAQLQTATTTIGSLKTRVATLEQQSKEREQAFGTLRTRLMERDKLVPQYNAMIAEVYQARHRIAALEQQVNEKTKALFAWQKGAQGRSTSGSPLNNGQRDGGIANQRPPSTERSPASNGPGVESRRLPSALREVKSGQAGQAPSEQLASAGKDDGRKASRSSGAATQPNIRNESLSATKEELLKVLPAEGRHGTITVKQDRNRLTVALAANRLFTPGDAALTAEGMTMLRQIGTVLGPLSDKFVQVAGHTDNQAISKALQKTFPDRKALSWARAENARRALINGGMPAERTQAVGLADQKPLASNATEQGRERNRRLELVIVHGPAVASTSKQTPGETARFAALGSSH